MQLSFPQDNLPHLAIEREPDLAHPRRPPPPFGSSSSRSDRGHHARNAKQLTRTAQSTVAEARARSGVDPSRLVVLELATFERTATGELERRLNATVVDERIQSRKTVNYLVEAEGFDESTMPTGSRFRLAREADINAAHKLAPADVPKDTKAGKHMVVELPQVPTAGVVAGLASWTEQRELLRITVQFATVDEVRKFCSEIDAYARAEAATTVMPQGERQKFFDAVEWIGTQSRDDRTGPRLAEEGIPTSTSFALDVDLWHPGNEPGARHVSNQLRALCLKCNGRVLDEMRTQSLVLARIEGNAALLDQLLDLDIVAQVDRPPKLDRAYEALFDDLTGSGPVAAATGTEPMVGVIDSGVLAGHPLLAGWVVTEQDFGTSESSVVDMQGHGTQVAGLVVYGDLAACLKNRAWTPQVQILSGKVLEKDSWGEPSFPEGRRPERMVEEAVRQFHEEWGCRIFNMSLGSLRDVYRSGARQFAWAEVLDELARELDVVMVVSAGNTTPGEPSGTSLKEMQASVRDEILSDPEHRLINPATAAIAVTVGSVARSATPSVVPAVVGSPVGAPSPFSRCGPGYEAKPTQRAVKPELVAHGGNEAWRRTFPGRASWRGDIHLGEPTTRLPRDGRVVGTAHGTSYAAPHVAHAAARALAVAQETLGTAPRANTVRALLGASSVDPECGREWLRDKARNESWEKLSLAGYGMVSPERLLASSTNDLLLLAEDELALDHWHIYEVPVPTTFLERKGNRGLSLALAFDPPVRASRKEYLANTMWFEVLKGLSQADIVRFKAAQEQQKDASGKKVPLSTMPSKHELDMRPTKEPLQWSTLQVRKKAWSRKVSLPIIDGQDVPLLHILIGSQSRFPTGLTDVQRYSLAIRFWHDDPAVNVYQHISSRVRLRPRSRARVQARG